jgi:NAD-dependent dihydropyrimidine dehydrogenase PreA subunit
MGEIDTKLPRCEVHADQCKGCELCIDVCPTHVLELSQKLNKMGYSYTHYKGDGCNGCGICFYACPEPGAITVYKK